MIKSAQFDSAINCLKQVKEKYCPRQMLDHIENTFRLIDRARNENLSKLHKFSFQFANNYHI